MNLRKDKGRTLQKSLASSQQPKRCKEDAGLIAHRFSRMMVEGQVSQALKLLMAPEYTGPRIGQLCLIIVQLMYVVHDWTVDYCI